MLIAFYHTLYLRPSDYCIVRFAVSNPTHPFLSLTTGGMTDSASFFMNLKSTGTNGYSRNILLYL